MRVCARCSNNHLRWPLELGVAAAASKRDIERQHSGGRLCFTATARGL